MGKNHESAHQPTMVDLLHAGFQFERNGFENPFIFPEKIYPLPEARLVLQMRENTVPLGLVALDENGDVVTDHKGDPVALETTVWGYGQGAKTGYLGPTIMATRDQPVEVIWQNKLPKDGHLLDVDTSIHIATKTRADDNKRTVDDGLIPTVVHLHGGETDADSDGYPEAWFTQYGQPVGPYYSGQVYTYDNEQEAATLWYHDHALGVTRLNVYAGLAGFYKLSDEHKLDLMTDGPEDAPGTLPSVELEVLIQDKAFTTDGRLYYPALKDDPLPDGEGGSGSVLDEVGEEFFSEVGEEAASALPEFFGDHILVNGVPWPDLTVLAGDAYTLNLLNGSDSRVYVLDFVTVKENEEKEGETVIDQADPVGLSVLAVGADGGLLPEAVDVRGGFVLAPGDRLDVVLDFDDVADGTEIRLVNSGPDYSPFKAFESPGDIASGLFEAEAATPDQPIGNIMQFSVTSDANAEGLVRGDPTIELSSGDWLNDPALPKDMLPKDMGPSSYTRELGLYEGADEYGRVQPLLGTAEEGSFHPTREYDESTLKPIPYLEQEMGSFGPLLWDDPITETPTRGKVETWNIYNFTADAHPVHVHLTQFEAIARYDIAFQDGNDEEEEDGIPDDTTDDEEISYGYYNTPGEINFDEHDIWVSNTPRDPAPEEKGRQDTVLVASGPRADEDLDYNIGEMLEIQTFFEKTGLYVWHCHILSHEDHEMMRPFEVMPEEMSLLG